MENTQHLLLLPYGVIINPSSEHKDASTAIILST